MSDGLGLTCIGKRLLRSAPCAFPIAQSDSHWFSDCAIRFPSFSDCAISFAMFSDCSVSRFLRDLCSGNFFGVVLRSSGQMWVAIFDCMFEHSKRSFNYIRFINGCAFIEESSSSFISSSISHK